MRICTSKSAIFIESMLCPYVVIYLFIYLFVYFNFYFRRQFGTVLDAFVKLEKIAEVIDEMLPKFSSQL